MPIDNGRSVVVLGSMPLPDNLNRLAVAKSDDVGDGVLDIEHSFAVVVVVIAIVVVVGDEDDGDGYSLHSYYYSHTREGA